MTKKVLHISRFRERYELPEDVRYDRQSPLLYTKDFVGSGNDDESCGYWQQLMALRSKSNYLALRGAFSDLKNIAGNKSKEYRGYLLDSNFQPASVKEIGRWLGISETKVRKVIEDLSDVGLLEYVALPQFNGEPRKRTGKPRRARARTGKPGKKRKRTGKTGKARAPLKKKANSKVNVKTKMNGNGKDNNTKEIKNGSGNRMGESNVQDSPEAPTTAPPIKPQLSAKGGSIQFSAPSELQNTERLGTIAKKILHRYDPNAKQFALEIYQALELPWDPTGEQGRRELGCFASVWEKAGISMEVIDDLRARCISEAQRIAKRRQNRKKGAVWCIVFKNLLASRCGVQKVGQGQSL